MTRDELLEIGPNPSSIRETIKEVRKFVEDERITIDFEEMNVALEWCGNECGTVACHGGLFTLALCQHKEEYFPVNQGRQVVLHAPGEEGRGEVLSYCHGADEFSKRVYDYLPDDAVDWTELVSFMMLNPDVWGNDDGGAMFESNGYRAFSATKDDDLSIDNILDWWMDVADRKEKWDEAKGIGW